MEIRDLEQSDVPALRESGISIGALLKPNRRVHLAMNPHIVGYVVWHAPPHPNPAIISSMNVTNRAPPETIHRLALHACFAALNEGFTEGEFDITTRSLLELLISLYGIEPLPTGFHAQTKEPSEWHYRTSIRDAMAILERVMPVSTS